MIQLAQLLSSINIWFWLFIVLPIGYIITLFALSFAFGVLLRIYYRTKIEFLQQCGMLNNDKEDKQ